MVARLSRMLVLLQSANDGSKLDTPLLEKRLVLFCLHQVLGDDLNERVRLFLQNRQGLERYQVLPETHGPYETHTRRRKAPVLLGD
jgi:hypothetical protein